MGDFVDCFSELMRQLEIRGANAAAPDPDLVLDAFVQTVVRRRQLHARAAALRAAPETDSRDPVRRAELVHMERTLADVEQRLDVVLGIRAAIAAQAPSVDFAAVDESIRRLRVRSRIAAEDMRNLTSGSGAGGAEQ